MGSDMFHKHPKGQPSKDRKPLNEINKNMELHMSATNESNIVNDNDYRETLHNEMGNLKDSSSKSHLPSDGIYGKHVLLEDALRQRKLIKDLQLDTKHILLGAAWVDEETWREFMRYPEVL
jgi:hypothetical protein